MIALDRVALDMDSDYYGIPIASVLVSDRWKWRVTLPIGTAITSHRDYATPEQALSQGKSWIKTEAVFGSLNILLAELCEQGHLQKREYCDLMDSLLEFTQRR